MKKVFSVAVSFGAVLVIAYATVKGSVAVVSWHAASDHALVYGSTNFVDREIGSPSSALAPLSLIDHGVVFVLSPQCRVCSANMSNWGDLMIDLKKLGVPMVAVAPAHADGAAEYWAGFAADAPLLSAEAKEISAVLGVAATPTTVVLRGGRVRAVVSGTMSDATRAQLLEFATRR